MGVQDLLKTVGVTERKKQSSLNKFELIGFCQDKRCAVDASAFLHRTLSHVAGKSQLYDFARLMHSGSAFDLPESVVAKIKADFREYARKFKDEFQCSPIFVFDGRTSPAKLDEKQRRTSQQLESFRKGEELWQQAENSQGRDKANSELRKSLRIVWDMVRAALEACAEADVRAVVAPYEADSQMAAMCLHGEVDFVVTEDSDLIVHGTPCILFGYISSSQPVVFRASEAYASHGKYDMSTWSQDDFCLFAALCGCDYVKLSGTGPRRAFDLVQQVRKCCPTDEEEWLSSIADVMHRQKVTLKYPEGEGVTVLGAIVDALAAYRSAWIINPVTLEQEHIRRVVLHPDFCRRVVGLPLDTDLVDLSEYYNGHIEPHTLQRKLLDCAATRHTSNIPKEFCQRTYKYDVDQLMQSLPLLTDEVIFFFN